MLFFKYLLISILFLLDLGTIITIKFGCLMRSENMTFSCYAPVIAIGAALNIALSDACLFLIVNH